MRKKDYALLCLFLSWILPGVALAVDMGFYPNPFPQPYPYPPVTRQIEDKKFEIIETGLEYMYNSLPHAGWWLSNDLLMVNALQDVPDAKRKSLQRVMLVDARTGKSKVLVPDGQMICWNSERQIAGFAPSPYNFISMVDSAFWRTRLDQEGNAERLSDKTTVDKYCHSTDIGLPKSGPGQGLFYYLREADGYLRRSEPGKPYDASAEALLVKPGQKPKGLGVRVDEIGNAIYLPYFNQYLLTSWLNKTNREEDIPPDRLMSPDGKITEMPYPRIVFEFISEMIARIQLIPQGQLFISGGTNGYNGQGLLLLQGERLIRLWGGQKWFAKGRNQVAMGMQISPDGCRIAFIHSAQYTSYSSTNPIAIINLCKEL
jgi:hypothetical protein